MAGHGTVIKNLLKFMIFKKKGIGKFKSYIFYIEIKKREKSE